MKPAPLLLCALLAITSQAAYSSNWHSQGAGGLRLAAKNGDAVPQIRDKFAVIIGVGEMEDPHLEPQPFSVDSANELSELFQDKKIGRFPASNVVTLTGKLATRQHIWDAINNQGVASKAITNDLVVVYLNGKAVISPDGRKLLLCPYDFLASKPEQSGLPMDELLGELKRRSMCRNVVCLLDLSPLDGVVSPATKDLYQSGAKPRKDGVVPSALSRLAQTTDVVFLSGSELLSPSFGDRSQRLTYFIHYLSEALKLDHDRNLADLSQSIGEKIMAAAKPDCGQSVELQAPADSSALTHLVLGAAVGKSGAPMSSMRMGYDYNRLPLTRPDLVLGAPQSAENVTVLAENPLSPRRSAGAGAKGLPPKKDDDDDEPMQDIDMGPYMAQLKKTIQSKWLPPKGLEQKKVVCAFTVMKDGTITNAEIVQTSGEPAVDKSALEALEKASPLQPLPMGAPKFIQVQYKFEWKVTRQ